MATNQVLTSYSSAASIIIVNKQSFNSVFSTTTHWSFPCPRASSSSSFSRRQLISDTAATAAAIAFSSILLGSPSKALALEPLSQRKQLHMPIDPPVVLLDIAVVPDHPNHGFLLGTRQTILETKDGGSTWVPRLIPSAEEEDFNSISFKVKGGWVIRKQATLLYTSDAGENWKRVPLSSRLLGVMPSHGDNRTSGRKSERPRFFDLRAKNICWAKAKTVPGRHPDRWRKDPAGNIVSKSFHGCQGCLCFEYDHIIPFSKGGPSVAENCQILQSRVNRSKADTNGISITQLEGYSCNIQFSDKELDIIEMAVYGDVSRPGKQCRLGSIDETSSRYKSRARILECKLP